MNKKGNYPAIVGVLALLVLLLGGYISFEAFTKTYDLQNVEAEDKNIGMNQITEIFFDVSNNDDLTFLGKIELIANKTCFNSPIENPLPEIQPHSTISSSINLRTEYNIQNRLDSCLGRPYSITLKLRDVSGKLLDEESISIRITRS